MYSNLQEERKLVKIVVLGLIGILSLFLLTLTYLGSQERSFANVGLKIFIGDEYRILKYKDKQMLEDKLQKLKLKTGSEILFYIFKKSSHIEKGKPYFQYSQVKNNQIKFFIGSVDAKIVFKIGDNLKTKIPNQNLEEYIDKNIITQLKTDLFETAIWDLHDKVEEYLGALK